jgi:hypothetical protein
VAAEPRTAPRARGGVPFVAFPPTVHAVVVDDGGTYAYPPGLGFEVLTTVPGAFGPRRHGRLGLPVMSLPVG